MTKQNILKTATLEFAKYGYDGLSMNNLASKLEVNKATIYYHFKDKKSLYQAVLTDLIRSKREETETIISSNADPKEKFKNYVMLYIDAVDENPEIVPLSLREMANMGAHAQNGIEADLEQEIEYIRTLLSQLNIKEKYKNTDPYTIKSIIMGTINTYYTMQVSAIELETIKDFNNDKRKVLEYLGELVSNILLDALCKE